MWSILTHHRHSEHKGGQAVQENQLQLSSPWSENPTKQWNADQELCVVIIWSRYNLQLRITQGYIFFLDIERSQDKCKKQSLKNGQVQGMGDLKVVRYKGWIFQMFEIVGRQPQVVGHSQNI